ncbi:hypothetical protein JYU34_008066 [Plutella xylostella]|uniref:C2H2-type domain-containing protein n=1 Tax=Plutella xylostella TaxID=51655 RepID=A0ABQ7QNN0_PLUXY|nr:hypothetical protein JYU34_008066 [Plutella xylostella]
MFQTPPQSCSTTINAFNVRSMVCATCLSNNRILHPLTDYPHLLNICVGLILDPEDNICWECRAILTKVWKFVQLAHRSSTVLRCLSQIDKAPNYRQQDILVQSLSTLTQSKLKDTYNAIYRHVEKKHIQPETQVSNSSFIPPPWDLEDLNPPHQSPPHGPQKMSRVYQQMYVKEDFVQPKKEFMSVNCEFDMDCGVKQELDTTEEGAHAMPDVIVKEEPHTTHFTVVAIETPNKLTNAEAKQMKVKSNKLITSQEKQMKRKQNNIKKSQIVDDKSMKIFKEQAKDSDDDDDDDDDRNPQTKEQKEYVEKLLNEQEMLAFRERMKDFKFYKTSRHRCVKCIVSFASEKSLELHNTQHSEKLGSFVCRICEQRFPDSSVVDLHIKTHYKIYVCSACAFEHYQERSVKEHIKRSHDMRVKKCKKCNDEFVGQLTLRRHKRMVHNRVTCLICYKKLSTINMKRHMQMVHGEVEKLECPVCQRLCPGELRLKQHMKTHKQTGSEDAFCAECGIQFKNPYLLKSHIKFNKRHNGNDQLKYECDVCEKRTATKTAMQYHIEAEHLKLANYLCDICNRRFDAARAYKRHVSAHTAREEARTHVCDVCGNAFKHRKTLSEHMNRHTGLRPYECKICGATFGFKASLYTHNKLVHLKQSRAKKKKTDVQ